MLSEHLLYMYTQAQCQAGKRWRGGEVPPGLRS